MAKKKLGTIYYDSNSAEGGFTIDKSFWEEHRVFQLDVLQDWAYYFTNLYNETLDSLYEEGVTNDK